MSKAGRRAFAEGLGKGIANFGEAFAKQLDRRRDEEIYTQMQDPNISPVEKAKLAASLSSKGQKNLSALMNIQNRYLREQERSQRHEQEFELRGSREERLNLQNAKRDLTGAYQARLKAIQDDLRDPTLFDKDQRKALKSEREDLTRELGRNLSLLKKGQAPRFEILKGFDEELIQRKSSEFPGTNQLSGQEQAMAMQQQPQGQMQQQPQQGTPQQQQQKFKWNPKDPQHVAIAQEAVRLAGGDRAKANALIAEHFER